MEGNSLSVKKRNPSFELLRVIAMLMILTLHYNIHAEVLLQLGIPATAVNLYLDEKKPSDFDTLKKVFSSFVNDEEGPMRYNEIENTACDGKKVYTYTQFRQYGEGENWTKFVTLCKKNGIVIKECRRIIDISI